MTREELLSALHMQGATEDDQNIAINDVLVVVDHRFADVIDEVVSEDQIKELDAISESGNPESVTNWIKENIPNAVQVYEEVLSDYVDELRSQIEG